MLITFIIWFLHHIGEGVGVKLQSDHAMLNPGYLCCLTPSDQSLIWELLYHAIYVPAGTELPSKAIVNEPDIAHYAENWGQDGDMGYKALVDGVTAGAAWLRLLQGYGDVADDIPELTIAVQPGYRGRGIGTALLTKLIDTAARSYPGISLSVVGENPAINLYRRMRFEIFRPDGASDIMVLRFNK
jgi:GNAT superfamily N-acetyltransferase